MSPFLKKAFPVICLLYFNFTVNAQLNDSTSNSYIPFDSLKNAIENKYQIKFFYNPIWFEGKEFSAKIARMPLSEAVSVITREMRLSFMRIRSYYVFLPASEMTNKAGSGDYYEIGDILEYGSKSHANVRLTVINGSNGQPLIGAKVGLPGQIRKYETNAQGMITMNLPVGEHELKTEYPGYETRPLRIKVYSDGDFTVEMYIRTIVLEEVSVVATKIDQYTRRTKMSMVSIDARSIRELPTNLGETDIIKGLTLLPGVQTTGEFGSGFNVRGGSSDQNLVLLEEVPLFNTSHLFGLTSIINPEGVSKATLYKGGIPVTYGERASSILSVKMGIENPHKLRVKGGIGLINSHLSLEIPVTKNLYILTGGRTSYSDWMLKSLPDLQLKNSSAGFNDLNFYASYSLSKRDELTLFAYSSNDKFTFSGTSHYNYGNKLGSLNYAHRFNSKLYTNLLSGVSYYNSGFVENDSLTASESYRITNYVMYNNLKWNWIWQPDSKHILTLGINGFLYRVSPGKVRPYGLSSDVLPETMENERALEWALFLGDDYEINDKIGLEFGIRYSNFWYLGPRMIYSYFPGVPKSNETISDSTFFSRNEIIKRWSGLEPRFTFRYNFSSSASVRFSYNRIYQYVNLVSNTAIASPTDLWKLSDPYVRPLIADQIAAGYFRNFNVYETSVEIYAKKYRNVIEYKNGAQIFMNQHLETDLTEAEGQSYGVEIYAARNSGKLTGWMSYTLSRSIRRTVSENAAEQLNRNTWFPDNVDRPHNLVMNVGYHINKRWKAGLTFNYSSGRPVTLPELKYDIRGTQIVYFSDRNKYRMPDYHRLDISISQSESLKLYKKWKGYWTFSLINVYGRKNAYSVFYRRTRSFYNYEGHSTLNKLYIIGRPIPVLTYNFVF